jgi:hypothetical protein
VGVRSMPTNPTSPFFTSNPVEPPFFIVDPEHQFLPGLHDKMSW